MTNLAFSGKSQTITGLGTVPSMEITVTFKPANTDQTWSADSFTGGDSAVTRSHTVEVYRGNQYVAP